MTSLVKIYCTAEPSIEMGGRKLISKGFNPLRNLGIKKEKRHLLLPVANSTYTSVSFATDRTLHSAATRMASSNVVGIMCPFWLI